MATKKQKKELIEILKFTPITARILIQGYGGETYAGIVDRKIYDYFASRKIDIEEYASDWDNELKVPEDMQPYPPGSAYECENLWHASGAELSDLNTITIESADGKTIWEHDLNQCSLEDSGVTVTEFNNKELDDLPDGTVVHWGGQGEKGCFFDGEFTLRAPFDPKKLEISYENCNDWYIVSGVTYDGEEIDGNSGYSTTGKWSENKWIIAGEEEVYDPVSQDDEEWDPKEEMEKIEVPVLDGEEIQAQEIIDAESDRSPWWTADIKPTVKGEYEIFEKDDRWPFPQRAEWTGRVWKQNGKKITIKEWRGLNYDPRKV